MSRRKRHSARLRHPATHLANPQNQSARRLRFQLRAKTRANVWHKTHFRSALARQNKFQAMTITCPNPDCAQSIAIEREHANMNATCPTCGQSMQLPELSAFSAERPLLSAKTRLGNTAVHGASDQPLERSVPSSSANASGRRVWFEESEYNAFMSGIFLLGGIIVMPLCIMAFADWLEHLRLPYLAALPVSIATCIIFWVGLRRDGTINFVKFFVAMIGLGLVSKLISSFILEGRAALGPGTGAVGFVIAWISGRVGISVWRVIQGKPDYTRPIQRYWILVSVLTAIVSSCWPSRFLSKDVPYSFFTSGPNSNFSYWYYSGSWWIIIVIALIGMAFWWRSGTSKIILTLSPVLGGVIALSITMIAWLYKHITTSVSLSKFSPWYFRSTGPGYSYPYDTIEYSIPYLILFEALSGAAFAFIIANTLYCFFDSFRRGAPSR